MKKARKHFLANLGLDQSSQKQLARKRKKFAKKYKQVFKELGLKAFQVSN